MGLRKGMERAFWVMGFTSGARQRRAMVSIVASGVKSKQTITGVQSVPKNQKRIKPEKKWLTEVTR